MKLKKSHISIKACLELQNYVSHVNIERKGPYGAIINIHMEKGEHIICVYRLYEEAKETYMKFNSKLRRKQKN